MTFFKRQKNAMAKILTGLTDILFLAVLSPFILAAAIIQLILHKARRL